MRDVDDGRKRGRERIKSKKPHFHVSAFDLADTSVHIHGEPTREAATFMIRPTTTSSARTSTSSSRHSPEAESIAVGSGKGTYAASAGLVGWKPVATARGDIASGLVSEKICNLHRALFLSAKSSAHEGRERRMCLVDLEYAPKVILVGTATFDNE